MSESAVPTPVISGCASGTSSEPCRGLPPGSDITVTMTHESDWVVGLPPFNLFSAPRLEGIGVMRCEYS